MHRFLGVWVTIGSVWALIGCGSDHCSSKCCGTKCVEIDSGPSSNDSSVDAPTDGPSSTDAPIADAPMDAVPDAPFDAPADANDLVDTGLDAPADAPVIDYTQRLYVVTSLSSPTLSGDIVWGLNLDSRVSDATDATTCHKADNVSPAPDNEAGVDNQLGPIITAQEGLLGLNAATVRSIAAGQLLLLIQVTGIDDYTDDPNVNVGLLAGRLPLGVWAPETDPSTGMLAADQTFDIDDRSYEDDGVTPIASFDAYIEDGRVHASNSDFDLALPLGVTLAVKEGQSRFNISPTALDTGVLAGSIDVDDTVTAVSTAIGATYEGLVRLLLQGSADMDKVGLTCQSISLGVIFSATTAEKGLVVPGV